MTRRNNDKYPDHFKTKKKKKRRVLIFAFVLIFSLELQQAHTRCSFGSDAVLSFPFLSLTRVAASRRRGFESAMCCLSLVEIVSFKVIDSRWPLRPEFSSLIPLYAYKTGSRTDGASSLGLF